MAGERKENDLPKFIVRQIKLRIQALINILIFTELFILSLTPFIVNIAGV